MAMVSLQSCYDRVHQYMTAGEYDKAEAMCRHILQYYPRDLGTFQLLGQINLERKQAQEAREHFQRVLQIDPENVSAHWGMGIAYQDEGKLEQAVAEFEQALEIKPDLSDLRSQLLRLYTDLYGASRAQLRLSRAGLGRLYVKGEMLDKAIEEFREVLKSDPSRMDVRLSLAEALWRAGSVRQSAQVCEQVVEVLPEALKANLILGYVRVEEDKQEEGEAFWSRAAACDPNNTMARAIFEMAPMRISQHYLAYDAATLPDFDEAEWEEAWAVEVEAAPAPEEVVLPEETVISEEVTAPVEEEEEEPVPAAPPEAESLGVSWLDSLATGEGVVEEEEGELIPGVSPFSLEELEAAPEEAPAEEVAELPVEEEPVVPAPPEEVAIEPVETPPEEAAAPEAPAEEEMMEPFSWEDLGLSEEEIAGVEEAISTVQEGVPEEAEPEPVEEAEELVPGVAPFSLEDLEGPAALEGVAAEAGLEELEGLEDMEGFSLEEALAAAAEEPGVEPPSLEGVEEMPPEEEPISLEGVEPFSLEGLGVEELPAVEEEAREEALIPGVEPFSLEGFEEFEDGDLEGVAPFALEELGLEEPVEGVELEDLEEAIEGIDEEGPAMPAFSWQEPGMREEPAFLEDLAPEEEQEVVEEAGPSLFEKMMSSRREAIAEEAPEEALEEELVPEGVEPFSLEEMGLEEAAAVAEEAPEEALDEGLVPEGVEPFSLEEMGLEETAAVAPEEALDEGLVPEGVAPFSLEELGLEETAAVAEEAPVEEPTPAVEPFSLEELGLEAPPSEEEVEAVAPEVAEVPPEEELLRPFTLDELGLTPEEISDLGLSEEELAQMGLLPEEAAAVAVEEAPEVPPEAEEVAVAEEPPLETLRQRWQADRADEALRLELARACARQGEFEEATDHYKALVKSGTAGLEDEIVADLQRWIGQEEDRKRLHRLHRLLGDTYMKQGLYQQAINEYAWVLSEPGK